MSFKKRLFYEDGGFPNIFVSRGDDTFIREKFLKKYNYDQAIILTNSLKSSLIPFFARIPIRTGWLGEMRYGLLNDIRYLDKNKNYLMVEKFAALSMKDSN